MEVAYMFLLAPAVVWAAVMVIKLFLYFNDPLRRLNISRRRRRSATYLRAALPRAPRLIKKTDPLPAPCAYRDLPLRPINNHRRMVVVKADFDRAAARTGAVSQAAE